MKKKLILITILVLVLITSMVLSGAIDTIAETEEISLEYVTAVEAVGFYGSHDVAVKDNIAYSCGYANNALHTIDVTNPESPVLLDTFTDSAGRLDGIHDIIIDGNIIYVTCINADSVVAIDITTPTQPSIIGEIVDSVKLDGVHALTRRGDYIYTGAMFSNYFNVIDISTPSNPMLVGSISDARLDGSRGVALQGDFAYVVCRNTSKMVVIDISTPSLPEIVNDIQVTTVGWAKLQNIDIKGDYAYVTCYSDWKVFVVDISDPYALSLVAELDIPYPNYISFSGDFGFVTTADFPGTVTVIDVSNPANPQIVTSLSHSDLDFACGVAALGDYLLCSARNTQSKILTVLHLSIPSPEPDLFIGDLYLGICPEQDKQDFLEALQSAGYTVIKEDRQPNGYEIYK